MVFTLIMYSEKPQVEKFSSLLVNGWKLYGSVESFNMKPLTGVGAVRTGDIASSHSTVPEIGCKVISLSL